METKVCITCGEEKPLSEFWARKGTKDGKSPQCKSCLYKIRKRSRMKAYRNKHQLDEKDFDKINGGYKVYILNHPKKGEHKYTVVGTNGNFFCAEKKSGFIQYLEENLKDD